MVSVAIAFVRVRRVMKKVALVIAIASLVAMVSNHCATAAEQSPSAAPSVSLLTSPTKTKWGPAPPVVPSGAQVAVLDGDPFKDGSPYTLRLKMPDGYRVGPHFHPTDENVTVLTGTLAAGMGDKFDPDAVQFLKPGGFVTMPKGMHHYVYAKGPTVVQVHGIGPFAFTYVNPSDDPRNKN
jgi:Cupin domain